VDDRAWGVTRRRFLAGTAAAALGGGVGLGRAFAQDAGVAPRIVYRRLGRTGYMVSHVVAAWDWNEFLYADAVAAGINYWHKIAGWPKLPQPLQALEREAWYCDIAIDTFEEEGAYAQFEWSRTSLGLPYIDAMKLHSLYEKPEEVGQKMGFLKAFDRLKAEGKVRHLAAAQHGGETAAICAAMIESGHFDHLQPAIGILPEANMLAMLRLAADRDVGIIAKKVMGAVGRAKTDAGVRGAVEKHLGPDGKWGAAVIKTVLAFPGVTAVVPRVENFEQLEDNLSTHGIAPAAGERAAVAEIRRFARAEQCSYCGQCLAACPQGVAISDCLRFATYHDVYGDREQAKQLYARLPDSRQAGACLGCGACEGECPQGMAVRGKLRRAHATLA